MRNPTKPLTRIKRQWVKGKLYRYYRRKDGGLTPLPDLPENDPLFLEAYVAAQKASGQPTQRAKAGTLGEVALKLQSSPTWASWSPITRKNRAALIKRILAKGADAEVSGLRPKHIRNDLAGMTPDAANGRLKVWRCLMRQAVEMELILVDPSKEVKKVKVKTAGYHSWTDAEIALYRERHAPGTPARLAFEVFWSTGQRREDCIRIGWQNCLADRAVKLPRADGVEVEVTITQIHIRQIKTGKDVWPVMAPELRRELELAGIERDRLGPWITTQYGRPFTDAGFGQKMRQWCDEAKLFHCTAHGVRKAKHRWMAERRGTANQIMAAGGWSTLAEAQRYTDAADRQELALQAALLTEVA